MTITNTEAVSDERLAFLLSEFRIVTDRQEGCSLDRDQSVEIHLALTELLSRRSANSAGGVEVKTLPWFVNGVTSIWTGELLFGVYYTIVDEGTGWRVFRHQFRSEASETEVAYVASVEQAKAAAQADFNQRILSAIVSSPVSAEVTAPRPLEEWHEDMGNVVWWTWRDDEWLGEPAYIGTPLDLGRNYEGWIGDQRFVVTLGGWPGYHTHWTPHPAFPAALTGKE